jgi:dolichol kinase
MEATITAKAPQLKLARIIDILKGNIPSLTIIADKILLKTIKVTISNCLVYIPEVVRLFFKPLLLPLIEPYQ